VKGLVALAALVLSVAACGGSGTGSSTSPSPSPVVDMQGANSSYLLGGNLFK